MAVIIAPSLSHYPFRLRRTPLRSGGRPLHPSAFGAPSTPGTAAIRRMNILQQVTENILHSRKCAPPMLVFSPTSKLSKSLVGESLKKLCNKIIMVHSTLLNDNTKKGKKSVQNIYIIVNRYKILYPEILEKWGTKLRNKLCTFLILSSTKNTQILRNTCIKHKTFIRVIIFNLIIYFIFNPIISHI